jgi:predicted alpha/beta-fold hydrolase
MLPIPLNAGAGTPITTPRLYSACHTDDLRQSLFYLSAMFPKAPLLGIGYSLGANVLTRYLAEEGGNSRLVSGCVVNCVGDFIPAVMVRPLTIQLRQPWDLKQNNEKSYSHFVCELILILFIPCVHADF